MRPPDEVVTLDELGDQEALSVAWRDLLVRLGGSDYCSTPDWALSWWETTGARGTAELALWRDPDGSLAAVVPLYLHTEQVHHRIPVPISTWVNLGGGRGNADHLRIASTDTVWPDVEYWLLNSRGRRPLHLRSLDPRAPVPGGPRVVTEEIVCPRLALGDDDPVPPAYRKRLDYYRRRLRNEGVGFDVVDPGTPAGDTLAALFDLHESRWERADGVRPTHLRERAAFFEQLARRADDQRGPVLVRARVEDRTVGVLLGFWFGTTFSYFQNGWDPTMANRNIGSVLIDEALDWARDRGATVFDFMRGTAPFKYRFGAVDHVDRSVLYPRGPEGRLYRWKYTSGRTIARRLERRAA